MEASRLHMQGVLEKVMEDAGEAPHVYFQPPESMKMVYPCIVYHMPSIDTIYSNNLPYGHIVEFNVKYITRDPTSKVPRKLLSLPQNRFDTYYTAENLHHYAYTITSTLKEVDYDTT